VKIASCTGFAWQGFSRGGGWGGGYRGGFCEKLPEASPMSSGANASRLHDGPALAKAKPISDGGSASGVTQLRSGEKTCATAIAAGERSETM